MQAQYTNILNRRKSNQVKLTNERNYKYRWFVSGLKIKIKLKLPAIHFAYILNIAKLPQPQYTNILNRRKTKQTTVTKEKKENKNKTNKKLSIPLIRIGFKLIKLNYLQPTWLQNQLNKGQD